MVFNILLSCFFIMILDTWKIGVAVESDKNVADVISC